MRRLSQRDGRRKQYAFELLGRLDWLLIFFVVGLCGLGVLVVYSATYDMVSAQPSVLFYKQVVWMGIGLVVMFSVAFVDYHLLTRSAYVWYGLLLMVLVYVLAEGTIGMGAQRWIRLGPISVQPSELGKVVLVIVLARYFADQGTRLSLGVADLWRPLLLVLVPVFLIAQQPDLGTALVVLFLFCMIVFVAGIRLRLLMGVITAGLCALPLLWSVMKPYQRQRVLTFLDPESDPYGAGYHIIQSKIAIGSGGIFGKGLLQGSQSQLRFLPERHTDFIFSVLAEELGMIGCLVFFTLFFMLILRGFEIARSAKDTEGALLVVGVLTILVLHTFINLGMTMGLLPVVGVPLPFISYGGSSMVTLLAGLGLVLNVRVRRLRFTSENERIMAPL